MAIFAYIYESRVGHMKFKYMGNVYRNMASNRLSVLRSKKFVKMVMLKGEPQGWWHARDIEALRQQIMWIDAELASREMQASF